MRLFEPVIEELRTFVEKARTENIVRVTDASKIAPWPETGKGGIVMQADTAVELGSPRDESVVFLVWTGEQSLLRDGRITLVGPDLAESEGRSLPFGKVVILGVRDFREDNCYERHRDIELMRYGLNLSGYMMRAVSQYGREWSRVSRRAVKEGLSFGNLGSALVRMYKSAAYVESAEVLFVTSSAETVRMLGTPGEKSSKLIGAMNKMATELSFDCNTCDYTDVCNEVDGLRSMRKTLRKEKDHD